MIPLLPIYTTRFAKDICDTYKMTHFTRLMFLIKNMCELTTSDRELENTIPQNLWCLNMPHSPRTLRDLQRLSDRIIDALQEIRNHRESPADNSNETNFPIKIVCMAPTSPQESRKNKYKLNRTAEYKDRIYDADAIDIMLGFLQEAGYECEIDGPDNNGPLVRHTEHRVANCAWLSKRNRRIIGWTTLIFPIPIFTCLFTMMGYEILQLMGILKILEIRTITIRPKPHFNKQLRMNSQEFM